MRKSNSATRARTASVLHIPNTQHIESHLGKKPPQAKIPIAFLFSNLHFNNVTEMLFFFTAAILLCAVIDAPVQNQRITFNRMLFFGFRP